MKNSMNEDNLNHLESVDEIDKPKKKTEIKIEPLSYSDAPTRQVERGELVPGYTEERTEAPVVDRTREKPGPDNQSEVISVKSTERPSLYFLRDSLNPLGTDQIKLLRLDQMLPQDLEAAGIRKFEVHTVDGGKTLIAGGPDEKSLRAIVDSCDKIVHPGRVNLDAKVDYSAAREAYKMFHLDKFGIDRAIVPATIRNEQNYLGVKDTKVQDPLVEDQPDIPKFFNWSIGPAQMKISHIEYLAEKYPDQLKQFHQPTMQAFTYGGMLVSERQATVGQQALSPRNAAFLVGAYFADKIDRLEHGKPACPDRPKAENDKIAGLWKSGDPAKRTEALIRSYNSGDGTVHVNNVDHQLKEIRRLHPDEI
jgi:hypothetical protein